MGQVTAVHVAPQVSKEEMAQKVEVAEAVIEAEKKIKRLSNPERRPWLYIRDQKVESLSNRQIKGELRRVKSHDFYGKVLQVVLSAVLDSHERGVNPFPR